MLTFEEKLSIIESFPQLERKNVSLKRVNFQFEESRLDKKNVVYHLHPNGNGFVYASGIKGYKTDDKGMVNIREFSAEELQSLIQKSIELLSQEPEEVVVQAEPAKEEEWRNEDGHILTLIQEDDMWNVYAGVNLDGTFNSYPEATEYLDEEGFSRK
ncbi:hypothetical protein [Bacillus gaemokensis]|uniref:Uncharacterized protein n=1 Tax=Bacillus gaemokensis TaxID=574375 RepID=A0A073K8D9_9BACI|nr:hypothetical protein [Bacillus gaemokensis]KEK22825.1 hypothetical protein BAGA_15655 [Bacillus gaemokensis]KYG30313.1 hypothetical protein AZF08_13325 [Bacillus gaemokensis]